MDIIKSEVDGFLPRYETMHSSAVMVTSTDSGTRTFVIKAAWPLHCIEYAQPISRSCVNKNVLDGFFSKSKLRNNLSDRGCCL